MASLKLAAGRKARVLHGHPWIFAGEVTKRLPPACDGTPVTARDANGRPLGTGFYNGQSQIVWRRLSRDPVEITPAFFQGRIAAAIARREPGEVRRLVWSEADGLPGLVVDQFGSALSVQITTLGMERNLTSLLEALDAVIHPERLVLRNDTPVRVKEGLGQEIRVVRGSPEPFWCRIGLVEFEIDLVGGQKTGAYLDQRQEYEQIARLAAGRRVLDLCCNQGGFALHAAMAGARDVVGIDSSETALAQARKNAERLGLSVRWIEANVFDWLRTHRKETFDLVILDPPPLGKSKAGMGGALDGYRDLNLRALRLLGPQGLLATYTCSHRVTREGFEDMLAKITGEVERDLRLIRRVEQPNDHPILMNFPESEYLRGAIVEVVP
ncbi:MAG: class I SAM-dependent rRNA methyltransferase [Candidatus Methylacidiphilales bacterium]